jgi:hypothetical protein
VGVEDGLALLGQFTDQAAGTGSEHGD